MFRNYLKVALRSFYKNTGYSLINVFGLAVAICSSLLITFFVRSEWSYDRFHAKSDRLYRAWLLAKQPQKDDFLSTITSLPLAAGLSANVPEIAKTCRVYKFSTLASYRNKVFNESVHLVDSTFFDMFDFKFQNGYKSAVWEKKNDVIITETIAKKYFPNEDPYEKTIEIQLGEKKSLFSVCGVIADGPEESSIKPDFLIPFSNETGLFNERMRTSPWFTFTETYVLLKKNTSALPAVHKSIAGMLPQLLGDQYKPNEYNILLQPITSIHLDKSLPRGIEPISDSKYSYIVSTAAVFLLITACLNFIILSMAKSTTRSMEVGVRKSLGAGNRQIQFQFFLEAAMLSVFSGLLALILTYIFFKPFSQIIGKSLSADITLPFVLYVVLAMAVITSIIGLYPSLVFARFKTTEVLKGKLESSGRTGLLGKSLIVAQFAIAIIFTVSTYIIFEQMNYLRSKDLGFTKTNMLVVSTNKDPKDGFNLAALFKAQLLSSPFVESVSIGMYAINQGPWAELGFTDLNTSVSRTFQYNSVDSKFLSTLGVQIVSGSNFQSDSDHSILVNEALVRQFGWENPVGMVLPGPFPQRVEGVVRDFNIESLHTPIKPLVLSTDFQSVSSKAQTMIFYSAAKPTITVKLKQGYLPQQMEELKKLWNSISPNQDFDVKSVDSSLANMYREDDRIGIILDRAMKVSLFISCIGLFGLVTLKVSHRTKEIAIRKVLGASIAGIVHLISKEFIVNIFIACAIAIPVALLIMNHWLADFAYRINVTGSVILNSLALVFLISIFTILLQTIKAGLANPTKGFRGE